MDSAHIYAGTHAYVLLQKLLSETQRELLLGAENYDAFLQSLRETFLGVYMDSEGADSEALTQALDRATLNAKREIERLLPNSELFTFIWLRYDFYNLKVLMKQEAQERSADIKRTQSPLGTLSPEALERVVQSGNFTTLPPALSAAVRESKKNTRASLDVIMDRHYLTAAAEYAARTEDPFVNNYVALIIDLFNLRTRLRVLLSEENGASTSLDTVVTTGGTIPATSLEKKDDVLHRLARFGGESFWRDAIATYEENGDFTLIDKAADDYLMHWLKRESVTVHSLAPIFAYFRVVQENVQFIRTVATAKYVGLDETLLRTLIRNSYNAYVY
ncbi:MAG: V-type ATPase subunit [Patescibacteria group bacterium UBA2163]